jgi:hypothetical protein
MVQAYARGVPAARWRTRRKDAHVRGPNHQIRRSLVGPRLCGLAAVLALLAFCVPAAAADPNAVAPSDRCGPYDAPAVFAQLGASDEPGIDPAPQAASAGAVGGQIITLPGASGERPTGQVAGEAILALPKGGGGAPSFELAPQARVVESYFSPVLCSTVVRLAGGKDDLPSDLVASYPPDGALVPNHVYMTAQTEVRPLELPKPGGPDPYRQLQWGVDRTGVERARGLSNGAGARVAVLDSAPQRDHRDLGAIRQILVDGGPRGAPGAHGTLVTGLVAAVENNAFGIAGLAPGAEMISVAVCTPAGASATDSCPLYTVLRGLDRAWEEQADIVNLSIVGPDNPLLARGMDRLEELGAVVVAAAGNEASDEPRYPAAYASVVGVGAIDRTGAVYVRSNRGLSAEILAPGVEVLSTVPGDAFSFGSGTSFSAAHVSSALAIAVGAGFSPAAARTAMFQSASARQTRPGAPELPPVCDVLARLGRACTGP